jgi:hypothetical protein
LRRHSEKAPSRRGASYLTRRGNSLAFQIRFPRDVDPDSSLAPIRVTLGPLPLREARRKVKRLAGLAELAGLFNALY